MANGKIKLEVVTPVKRLVSAEVDEITEIGRASCRERV